MTGNFAVGFEALGVFVSTGIELWVRDEPERLEGGRLLADDFCWYLVSYKGIVFHF